MPDTDWIDRSLKVRTKVDVLLHGSFGGFGWLMMLLFSHEVATSFSSLGPFFSNPIGTPEFTPMVSCKHAQLYLYDSSIVVFPVLISSPESVYPG